MNTTITAKTTLADRDPIINLERELKIRGFSRKTVKSYLYYNINFLKFIAKSPKLISNDDIKKYLEFQVDRGVGSSTLSVIINALKFYYQQILGRNLLFKIRHPKKPLKLPVVLTKEEIKKIILSVPNKKYRLMLALMYASGLRVSEVVKLKAGDLDFNNRLIFVRQSKGKKDRRTIMPEALIPALKKRVENRNADDYLFESNREGRLSERSLQKMFALGKEEAGITGAASCHSLRHSFATHLLENGTDIRYIQELLGHKKLETTQIYTKVTANKLKDIKNPLDNIF